MSEKKIIPISTEGWPEGRIYEPMKRIDPRADEIVKRELSKFIEKKPPHSDFTDWLRKGE